MPVSGDYTYTVAGGNATITDYSGAGGSITIPTTLDATPVVAIAYNAMKDKSITSLTINHAVLLNGSCFANNTGINVVLNANVTTSSVSAFSSCSIGSGLTITSNVTTIPSYLFQSSGLTSLSLPSSVISIGSGAFQSNNLTSLTLPNNITTIGGYAFATNSLTSLTLDHVISLGGNSFASNTGMGVVLDANVTTNSISVFSSCAIGTGLTITSNVTTIPNHLFQSSGLTSLSLPSSVTTIGNYAFATNSDLAMFENYSETTTYGNNVLDGNMSESLKGNVYGYSNSTTYTWWLDNYTGTYNFNYIDTNFISTRNLKQLHLGVFKRVRL